MPEFAINEPLIHICEVCGVEKVMTPEEAFNEGWDYPPGIGEFTVVSPRTCGNCGIDKTLYWKIITAKDHFLAYEDLTDADRALIERIKNEPESIRPQPRTETEN